ncbi:NAD-dependent epimerase/dehydratase family protein [Serpentinicella sp. ANB-PHB4]|uniref:NAD-dependent epimerase/dehydratase family protein n=1 Tax=Serpentinicella sp. ANB-PHB4 TaxID=3074076 RepID=UPI00285A6F3D|nr:NAD-dependent epimerase/dehydratase family protein [Serpentinicella sp. ANB-PHB4]MDR5658453.1 NAD-dependent epimerase/dehydratase family protein [Serpentinicella sp. ANB-PHB4]
MKLLVIGGAGFIGSNLVDTLLAQGHFVTVIDNLSTGKEDNIHSGAKFYYRDITDPSIIEIFKTENFDIVFHLAAQISVSYSHNHPIEDASTNILGTINVLNACLLTHVKKIIFSSSAAVYGEPNYLGIDEQHPLSPISFYGLSKLSAENYILQYAKSFGLDYTILRYANVYGKRQDPKGEGGVISIFIDHCLNNKKVKIYGDGSNTRDFIYVDDVVNANILSMKKNINAVLNIGTGKSCSIINLYALISKILNISETPIYARAKPGDIENSFFDINKSKEMLNWSPKYALDAGLKKSILNYKNS